MAIAGCGRAAGVIFEPLDPPLRWPTVADTPRIEYVGALATEEDLKPPRSFLSGFGRAVFGGRAIQTMLSPMDIATAGERVFVADSNAQVVHVFDLNSRRYDRWAPSDEVGGFGQPVALAADDAGRLYVADAAQSVIYVFDNHGELVGTWGQDILNRPAGIAFDTVSRRLLVTDSSLHQIVVFDLDGELVRTVGQRGTGLGQFNFPTAMDISTDGLILVSDSLNFRVQIFGQDLKPIQAIGSKGDMPGYFGLSKGAAFDPRGNVLAVDAHFEAVQLFDNTGRFLMSFGQEGHEPGEFWLPVGVHVGENGWVWIADSYNKRIQVFRFLNEAEP